MLYRELQCSGLFGLRLENSDGDDDVEGTTSSFMDMNVVTDTNLRNVDKETVTFNNNDFYWKTDLNGIWLGTDNKLKFGLNN